MSPFNSWNTTPPHRWLQCLLGLASPLLLSVSTRAQSLETEFPTYFVEEPFNVSFKDGPGNPKDWIGVYGETIVPGSPGNASTRWDYVDDTRAGNKGLSEGVVNLPGLSAAGTWTAHLLLNDGYTILSQTNFTVVDVGTPLVRTARKFAPKSPIQIQFFNGPGNTKDWVGVYKLGQVPGTPNLSSTIWAHVDGTQNGTVAQTGGTLTFSGGLTAPGEYVAFFLENDGYTALASQPFSVVETVSQTPRVLSVSPANQSSNLPPVIEFNARITNGVSKVLLSSIEVQLDGVKVQHSASSADNGVNVSYSPDTLPAPGSTHRIQLQFKDDASPATTVSAETTFTIGAYRDIRLPAPIAGTFENFDAIPEGQVPAGWTVQNHTDTQNQEFDFGNLDSATYANWVAVDVDRFKGSFVTYSNPDNPQSWEDDYHRVLSENRFNVLNGAVVKGPLASGRMLFADSGYRNGLGQIQYVFTPDYNLTGQSDVHVAFKSLWEQNQDSVAALEYSIDKGASWLPVFYLLDGPDIVQVTDETTGVTTLDADATFNTERNDIARWMDPDTGDTLGGTYGSFLAAPITPALAPFIQARGNDNPTESKRIELYRLPKADNQKTVRFRFANAGTDSWYWGIDDFGLYSIGTTPATPPTLSWSRSAGSLTVSWPTDAAGYILESTESLSTPTWSPVAGVTGTQATLSTTDASRFLRLRKL